MTELVEWEDVAMTYPGPSPTVALHPTSLIVRHGEHVAIVGPSGAGKSTMLNLLGLLHRPTEGQIRFCGLAAAEMPERARTAVRAVEIGFIFQSFHLLPDRTVLENVALGMMYRRCRRRRAHELASEAIERVGLERRRDALAVTLSGGERQRTAIARAIVGRPRLLLADEPTGNLDSATGESVLQLFESLLSDRTTLVVVTHDPDVAARADRVLSVRDGRVSSSDVEGLGSAR